MSAETPDPQHVEVPVPEEGYEAAQQAFERVPEGAQFREKLTQLPEYGEAVVSPSELARSMTDAAAPFIAAKAVEGVREAVEHFERQNRRDFSGRNTTEDRAAYFEGFKAGYGSAAAELRQRFSLDQEGDGDG